MQDSGNAGKAHVKNVYTVCEAQEEMRCTLV